MTLICELLFPLLYDSLCVFVLFIAYVCALCRFYCVCLYFWAASYDRLMPSLAACHCNNWYVYVMYMYLVNKLSLSVCYCFASPWMIMMMVMMINAFIALYCTVSCNKCLITVTLRTDDTQFTSVCRLSLTTSSSVCAVCSTLISRWLFIDSAPWTRCSDSVPCVCTPSQHNSHPALYPGLYLSNFIRGVEVLAIEVDDRANA